MNELLRVIGMDGVVSVELVKDDNCDPSVGVRVTVAAGVPTSLDKEIEQLLTSYASVRITTAKPPVVYTVSNDGGKTGICWRDDVHECLEYLKPHREGAMADYCVVAMHNQFRAPR